MVNLLGINKFLAILSVLTALSLIAGTATVSRADSLNEQIRDFQHFLNEHPRIAADLQRDPSLANNRRYLNDHENLRDFLHNHPQVRREIAVNPARAMGYSYGRANPRYDYRGYGYDPRYNSRPYGYGYDPRYNNRGYGYDPRYNWPWWRR
jgi:hypothetical protein